MAYTAGLKPAALIRHKGSTPFGATKMFLHEKEVWDSYECEGIGEEFSSAFIFYRPKKVEHKLLHYVEKDQVSSELYSGLLIRKLTKGDMLELLLYKRDVVPIVQDYLQPRSIWRRLWDWVRFEWEVFLWIGEQ